MTESWKMVTALPPYFSTSCLELVSRQRHLESWGKNGRTGLTYRMGWRPKTQKGLRDAERKKRKEEKATEKLRKAYM